MFNGARIGISSLTVPSGTMAMAAYLWLVFRIGLYFAIKVRSMSR